MLALFSRLPAEDLVGIPVPGRVSTAQWLVDGGDTDLGANGGGSGDDWRVGHGGVAWDHSWIAAAVDYSILTSQNPSRAPIYWGLPNPFVYAHQGAGRSDEITSSLALRAERSGRFGSAWVQAGPGLQLSGDFGGEDLQNDFHNVIGNTHNDLGYVQTGLRVAGFVHAGIGDRIPLAGPFALDARALGLVTTSGWSRWRAQALLFTTEDDHGLWVGMRQDGTAGHALTTIADAVAQHESGLGFVCGMSWATARWQMSFETYHNFNDDGQDGLISVGYRPSTIMPVVGDATDGLSWQGSIGLCGYDTRVPGHGTDVVLAAWSAAMGLPRWLDLAIGFRDQDIHLPYSYDLSGRRLMLWGGLASNPRLLGGQHWSLTACLEGGVGVRSASITSNGFVDVDGQESHTDYSPLLRAAAGLGGWYTSERSSYGLVVLLEATTAEQESATVQVHDPFTPTVVREQQQVALDGNSLGSVAALSMAWNW